MKAKYIGVILLAGGILSGCSGGSGEVNSTPEKVTITPINQLVVANAAINTATQDLGDGASYVDGVPISSPTNNDRILFNVTEYALQKMEQQQSTTLSVSGPAVQIKCAVSGTLSIDTDITSPTSGTYIKITHNNCVDIAGEVSNGTISITDIIRTTATLSAKFAANIKETTSNNGFYSLVGGYTISITGRNTAAQVNKLSGTSLVLSSEKGSFSLTGADRNGFYFIDTFNNSPTTANPAPAVIHSADVGYTVAITDKVTPANSYAFSVKTTAGDPLVKRSDQDRLRSGQLVIVGAALTALRVTILPSSDTNPAGTKNGQYTLELSTDGGTNWGKKIYKTWASI